MNPLVSFLKGRLSLIIYLIITSPTENHKTTELKHIDTSSECTSTHVYGINMTMDIKIPKNVCIS